MRAVLSVAMVLSSLIAEGQVAWAQEKLIQFEISDERKQEIALSISAEAEAAEPARLRDVIGLEEGTARIVCGHALVENRSRMSMGYRPFAGYIVPLDDALFGTFTLVGYGFPIGPVDTIIYEQCERFGFRL